MKSLDTKIRRVTVFPDGARVMRSGTTPLGPGRHSLKVGPLPLAIDPASVRVSAHGTAHAVLLGVEVSRQTYTETPAEQVRELEREIELLEARIADVEGQLALCTEERMSLASLLQNTEALAKGIAFGKLTTDAHMDLVGKVRQRCADLDGQTRELAVTRRELERAIQKPRLEIERLQSATAVERYVASVDAEVSQGGDLTIELSSLVLGASWSPLYDLRVTEDGEPVLGVGYLGQVVQQTGEAWEGIELVLSTARPSQAATLPDLMPWYLSPMRSRMELMDKSARAQPGFAMAALATGAEAEAEVDVVRTADIATAAVEITGISVSYRVAGTVTIPPDGSPRKATVARFDLHPQVDYVATPKLVEDVYRRARITNDTRYVFLAGPANLFSDEDFVGRTAIEHVPPGGTMELYLGACDQVMVTRELTKREVDRTFIGNRRTISLGYETKVENAFSSDVRVVLLDQLPVPRDEEIKVKLERVEPAPAIHDDLGSLTWELDIPGRTTQVVRLEFSVEHPRQMEIAGLP